ncbi:SWI/SNF-related matrix-associated actin-dependent regulator of chromatin subfamily A-like protein 1 [Oratosquilla oratoria]|uniref:SWI/SNF-related matrix-associated actin-dependent regulator of chromatin subfamily A-like protein 1 n=1 Tax=Oratosquilla oratoria TaxID=337810 RepID=UPI003F76BFBC
MSSLTEEQRRRMEENKRKALERRALQQKSVSNPPPQSVSQGSTIQNKSGFAGNNTNNTSIGNNFYKNKHAKDNTQHTSKFHSGGSSPNKYRNFNSEKGAGNSNWKSWEKKEEVNFNTSEKGSASMPTAVAKPVNGTIKLLTKERFVVDVGYHAQMIEVFKTIPSKKYDTSTRKWDFHLNDHDKLVSALNPLRPSVCISPLPSFVRKCLQEGSVMDPNTVDISSLDPQLIDALMPFQYEGVCYGLSRGGRVLMADDMGLGKTIQALAIASYYRSEWPLLIVCPSSVRYSWVQSIERWLSSCVDADDIVVLDSGKELLPASTVLILSYDLLTKKAKEVLQASYGVIIMDESHMLKNFKTARFKAASPIMQRTNRLILLSGTPALSRPNELFTQISAINKRLFPNFQEFGIRYCAGKQTPWGWDFTGSSHLEELHIILKARIMIRRLKGDVLDQLPAKQRMTVLLSLRHSSKDKSMLESMRKLQDAANELGRSSIKGAEKHTLLLQYFAKTAQLKVKAVCEYVKDLLESDKKFLIFSHHRLMLDALCDVARTSKCGYVRIDGSTPGAVRQEQVDKFQHSDEVRIAILSITAANTGITLTAANLVVFAELFWNPGILMQAEDRAHRIGQEDCVLVQYLVAQGTVDDYIWPLIQTKLEVLGKAGLAKDNFKNSDFTKQEDKNQETILKYLSTVMEEEDDIGAKLEDDVDEPAPKKIKR